MKSFLVYSTLSVSEQWGSCIGLLSDWSEVSDGHDDEMSAYF